MSLQMLTPPAYHSLSDDEKSLICNGAGPRGKGWLVPDTMYGLSVKEAANIHDYSYHIGVTHRDKLWADIYFLVNLVITIMDARAGRLVTWWRLKRALVYFLAVWRHGDSAFEAGKETAE